MRNKCNVKNIEIALDDNDWCVDPFGMTEGDKISIDDVFNTNFVISTGYSGDDWAREEKVSKDKELFEILGKNNNYKAPVKRDYL